MDALFSFLGSDSVQLQFMAFVFGSVRIIVFASFAPFLGPQLTAPVLFPLICALYIPVHPLMLQQCQDMELQFATIGDLLQAGLILCKEALLGYLYLQGRNSRILELFELVWQGFDPDAPAAD